MSDKLNALDLAFLSLEKQTTPVNIASLSLFEIPENYQGNYARDLLKKLEIQPTGPPFNLKLSSTSITSRPSWIEDEHFDIHYHVRHSALPKPGTMEDLLELVSRLHSHLLDRGRPLWEFHLIEGLQGNRFATYLKMHHASIDGMGGIALMESYFNTSPDDTVKAPWTGLKSRHKNRENKHHQDKPKKGIYARLKQQAQLLTGVSKLTWNQGLKAVGLKNNIAPAPFSAPKSLFNVPISSARRFAIKSLSLSRIKATGKQADATVNDMVLAMCSGALRQYMQEKGELPDKPLSAIVPVSVRQLNRSGNQITYVMVNLATDQSDSLTRLAKIEESTQSAKREIENVSSEVATGFAVMAQGLTALAGQLNITQAIPPPANVTISNVPGPRQTLYFGDARLLETYPLSVLVDGQSLNITVVSYCDSIDFGFMACRETLPDVQKLADFVEEELDTIEARLKLESILRT